MSQKERGREREGRGTDREAAGGESVWEREREGVRDIESEGGGERGKDKLCDVSSDEQLPGC